MPALGELLLGVACADGLLGVLEIRIGLLPGVEPVLELSEVCVVLVFSIELVLVLFKLLLVARTAVGFTGFGASSFFFFSVHSLELSLE